MRTLGFLLMKESRQIFRDRTMLRMLIAIPIVQLLVLSSAATFDVRGVSLWVVDQDRSQLSQGLVDEILGSGHFVLSGSSATTVEADVAMLGRKASVIMKIPEGFSNGVLRRGTAPVQLTFDAQDGAQAAVVQSYLLEILAGYGARLTPEPGFRTTDAALEVRTRAWYNPGREYHDYMVPGILVVLVTIIGLSIASMNIVRERELGTLEQMNVTPVTRTQFIASKLIPFWIIAMVDLGLGLGIARMVFSVPIEGSLLLVFLTAAVYLLVALGLGLWISTLVETQQQAMFLSFSVNMVFLLMSGLFTPVASMPDWAQVVAQLSPVKHFIQIMRTVLVRGGGVDAIWVPTLVLAGSAMLVLTLAVRQYRKTTG